MTPTQSPMPRSILFVCNQNAVRSPMAEALAKRHTKGRIFVESVGLIAGALDPFSVAAMAEEKIDISNHEAKTLQDVDLHAFDLIITLTPESHAHIVRLIGDSRPPVEYWPTPDPSDAEGNRSQIMDSYRLVRDHLEVRIADRFTFP
ncbi:low molecular weight phosphatase family protein [Kordiimonas marina]|uniref:arsenate-mycothiol transferase ArsC n=1 Tax=Kordiimonas marina TaxID=2872312 RepID=UPI001FF4C2C4|nr:low molecular weight phosphatase family protein [Kordiimonas marina]MCJ9430516.1 low molecular weight phosphatase family protein [Kordiimonas marina]